MVIGFTDQFSNNTPIFVVLSRTVSQGTIKKIELALEKLIACYGEANNGDYSGFDMHGAIERVMNSSRLKWNFFKPDVFIYY